MMRKLVCFLTVALLAGFIAACGQTGIRNTTVRAPTNVARPERILVYDFAVSAQEVKEYQGIMRQQPTIKDAAERERLLAQEVKDALADELIEGLRSLGFRVERAKRGTPATGTDMLIDGQFLTVDEGKSSAQSGDRFWQRRLLRADPGASLPGPRCTQNHGIHHPIG